jgi:general secretion pathway protein F
MASAHNRRFRVAAKSASGSLRILKVQAHDAEGAKRIAELEGLAVLSCEPLGAFIQAPKGVGDMPRSGRLDVALFAQELASLLDAGLGIIEALETLAEKDSKAASNRILKRLLLALREGRRLSAVMVEMPEVFPPLLAASVASSEETGDLVSALRRYADNYQTLRNLRSKVASAAVYPTLLLIVGMLVVAFLLGVVVPKFSLLIESSHGEIPAASRMLLTLGNGINQHPAASATLFACLPLCLGIALYRAHASGWNQPWMQRLPVMGGLLRMFRHAQFYRTSGMLIEGGIPAIRAFEISGALLSPADRTGLTKALMAIRQGHPLATALSLAGLANAVAMRMLNVSQRTGQLASILVQIASFQEATLARAIDLATRLFEPMLMIFIGLLIGAIVVLMYLPIFDLASSLQ